MKYQIREVATNHYNVDTGEELQKYEYWGKEVNYKDFFSEYLHTLLGKKSIIIGRELNLHAATGKGRSPDIIGFDEEGNLCVVEVAQESGPTLDDIREINDYIKLVMETFTSMRELVSGFEKIYNALKTAKGGIKKFFNSRKDFSEVEKVLKENWNGRFIAILAVKGKKINPEIVRKFGDFQIKKGKTKGFRCRIVLLSEKIRISKSKNIVSITTLT